MSERSERLKIGFVLDDSLDRPDGVQQYVLTLGNWLSAQGHDVHYLVGETKRVDIPNIHSLAKNVKVRFNKNELSIPLPAKHKNIEALLKFLQLDILHVQMPYNPMLAARIIKAADTSTAVFGTFHILPNSRTELMATRALRVWLASSLKRFDCIYSVSAPAKDFAARTLGVQSSVMPNIIDMNSIKVAGDEVARDYIHIVFLGRLVERKGCGYLLSAIHALPPDVQARIRVTICGRGPLEPKLKSFAEQNNLAAIVQFAGFITEAEKSKYLRSADIAVFPSTGGESFGIVLIEAMASGAGVVLGGNNPGYTSVLNDERVIFNPKDTAAFAQKLTAFITDPALRTTVHESQKQLVKSFDVATVGPRITDDYYKMIAKRRNN